MGKLSLLICLIAMAIASMTAYIVLSDKIASGQQKIDEGQAQWDKGQKMLNAGKAKLAAGKRKFASAARAYRGVKSIPLMGIVDKLPVTNLVFQEANKQIAEGGRMIAKGEMHVRAGEARLAAGKLELEKGKQRLGDFNKVRVACKYMAIFFAILSITVGVYWRRSLISIFKREKL